MLPGSWEPLIYILEHAKSAVTDYTLTLFRVQLYTTVSPLEENYRYLMNFKMIRFIGRDLNLKSFKIFMNLDYMTNNL